MTRTFDGVWPPHGYETRPWISKARGPKADRMFKEVDVSLPPLISGLTYTPSPETAVLLEEAAVSTSTLDIVAVGDLAAMSSFLLRSESIASSKIERVDTTIDDFAKALVGVKSSQEASTTVAAVEALQQMIDSVGPDHPLTREALLSTHHTLMKDDPYERHHAGTFRMEQNWIGGSDFSPRGAVHVPPPPETVEKYVEDLIAFSNGATSQVIAQAAILHAQFESVHPFTDGNGRIGRALITAVTRRRGLTGTLVSPVASVMLADVETYFSHLDAYRTGNVDAFVVYLAQAYLTANTAARKSLDVLRELPEQWMDMVKPRANSAQQVLLSRLLENPVLTVDSVMSVTGVSEGSAARVLDQLVDKGVLHPVSTRRNHRVWAATEVMDEIGELHRNIGVRKAPPY